MNNSDIFSFTLVFDYRGGTYLNQCSSSEAHGALVDWVRALDPTTVDGLEQDQYKDLVELVLDDELMIVAGLHSVWCFSALLGDDLAIINLIKTAR